MIIKWDTAVLNLRGKGWTYKQIGARVGVTEPRIGPAMRLLDLHLDMCPDKHMDLI